MTQEQPAGAGRAAVRFIMFLPGDVFLLGVAGYFAARLVMGAGWAPVALAANFINFGLLMALPLLAWALVWRGWVRAGALLLPLIAFGVLFGGLFLPQPAPQCPDDSCRTLTVMSFNMLGVSPVSPEMAQLLTEADADVLLLQEVGEQHVTFFEQELRQQYPHQALHGLGIPGMGIASKYPIVEEQVFTLVIDAFPYQTAVIDVEGQRLTVFNAHPPPPRLGRRYGGYASSGLLDMPPLTDRIKAVEGPVILGGDFNAVDQSLDYAIIRDAGLEDAWRAAGWGFGLTFPDRRRLPRLGASVPPVVRIDYIFYSQQFQAVQAWRGPSSGSDHRPVLAELLWNIPPEGTAQR